MLTAVALSLLALIALLAIPVTLSFQISWQRVIQGRVDARWAFGLVHMQLPLTRAKAPPAGVAQPAQKIDRVERSPLDVAKAFAVIRQSAFRRRISRFFRDCWHAINKSDISLRVRIGLGDPADTGQLWAFLGPVAGILSTVRGASIDIIPEFYDATFELDSRGNIRLIPLRMIYLTAGLLFSPPVWRGIRQMSKTE